MESYSRDLCVWWCVWCSSVCCSLSLTCLCVCGPLLRSGVDGRWDSDLLLLRHLSGLPHRTGELQQVQQQLLQVRDQPQRWCDGHKRSTLAAFDNNKHGICDRIQPKESFCTASYRDKHVGRAGFHVEGSTLYFVGPYCLHMTMINK